MEHLSSDFSADIARFGEMFQAVHRYDSEERACREKCKGPMP